MVGRLITEEKFNIDRRQLLLLAIGVLVLQAFFGLVPNSRIVATTTDLPRLFFVSEAILAFAFSAVPILLIVTLWRRRAALAHWEVLAIAFFCLFTGTTHALDALAMWKGVIPAYPIVRLTAALLGLLSLAALYVLVPRLTLLATVNEHLRHLVDRKTALLSRKTEELERSNRDLEQFAYVASHDLQEPLRMISSYCQLLSKELVLAENDPKQTYLDFAIGGAVHMKDLIDDLLEFSRVGRNSREMKEYLDFQDVVTSVLTILREQIRDAGASLHVGYLPKVTANRSSMVRLFQNLIANSIKYRKPEQPLEITIDANYVSGGEWVFSVKDNGMGIAPEHIERIFVIFQRLHAKTRYPGTGMGLAISKKIVESHGGKIWVQSTPNQGSEFFFSIPRKEASEEETQGEHEKYDTSHIAG